MKKRSKSIVEEVVVVLFMVDLVEAHEVTLELMAELETIGSKRWKKIQARVEVVVVEQRES